jgi:Uma2 family endonuclease
MVTLVRTSLAEYLAMEETKPYSELIDGEVIQKSMPSPDHSASVIELAYEFSSYLRESREARVDTELRHADIGEDRGYLPDVSVTLLSRFPRGQRRGTVEIHPDIAIEVLSPDDRPGRVIEKVQFYLRAGVPITWVVDPDGEAVVEYRPGREPVRHTSPAVIDVKPVLSAFTLDVGEFFRRIRAAD